MGLPGGVSVTFIVALVVCVLGIAFQLVGMSTPEWTVWGPRAFGLFESCGIITEPCTSINYVGGRSDASDQIRAASAMHVLGALCGLAALTVALIHLGIGCLNKEPTRCLSRLAGVLAIVAFVFILIGIAVWLWVHDETLSKVEGDYQLGFSFFFSVTGGIIHLVAGILFLVSTCLPKVSDIKEGNNTPKSNKCSTADLYTNTDDAF